MLLYAAVNVCTATFSIATISFGTRVVESPSWLLNPLLPYVIKRLVTNFILSAIIGVFIFSYHQFMSELAGEVLKQSSS